MFILFYQDSFFPLKVNNFLVLSPLCVGEGSNFLFFPPQKDLAAQRTPFPKHDLLEDPYFTPVFLFQWICFFFSGIFFLTTPILFFVGPLFSPPLRSRPMNQ